MSYPVVVPTLAQHDGRRIPQLGLGAYGPSDAEAPEVIRSALELGYRLIDTAALYQNESGVGRGIRDSGVPREDIYLTTKLADDSHGYDQTLRAFDASLDRLGLDYVDLYLIHWPQPRLDKYVETWRALIKLHQEGRTRSIGVSNFQPPHIQRLVAETGITPVVNQVELHPELPNREVRDFDAKHQILTQSWSPLARGRVFASEELAQIAKKHGRSIAQIVLRWHIELDLLVIPKSANPQRLKENLEVYSFALDPEDHQTIAGLETGIRTGDDPDLWVSPDAPAAASGKEKE